MSGLRRAFRHPDRSNDPHARAKRLVSDGFLEPLAAADEGWLAGHLARCAPCRQLAADWAADRAALRSLVATAPVAPRDLGARLAAALDAEDARAPRAGLAGQRAGRVPAGRPGRSSRLPAMRMALVAAAAAIALVVLPVLAPFGAGPLEPSSPAATPILVAAAPVTWAQSDQAGRTVVQAAVVDRVCPGSATEACGTIDQDARSVVTLDLQPSQVILPPRGDRAIAIGPTGVYTFVIPERGEAVTPGPAASSQSPTHALPTPAATEVPASPPADTPAPSDTPPAIPSSPSPPASTPATTAPGSDAPGSPVPTATAQVGATVPPGTPAPVAATALAILEDVVLVGAAPAYSVDGSWLAFSARPVAGGQGPDVYVWQVGDERARHLTSGGASVFSGWLGNRILASSVDIVDSAPRPDGSAGPDTGAPTPAASPAAGEPGPGRGEAASPMPVSSPPSTTAPAGTEAGQVTETPAPAETPPPAASDDPSVTPAPAESAGATAPAETAAPASPGTPSTVPTEPGASPLASASPSASPRPNVIAFSFLVDPASGAVERLPRPGIWRPVVDPSGTIVVYFTGRFAWSEEERSWVPASGSLVVAPWVDVLDPERPLDSTALPGTAGHPGRMQDWDVRWSESGDHLAVWLADEGTAPSGRLSLYASDESGRPDETLLDGTAALPAFSIDVRRLAWATPAGTGGEGSRVGVFAWDGAEPGAVYSAPQPGEDIVVVR